ncbi:hypothetical protein VTI74DRAFT_9265 [Chaetomium olivicolor]
MTRFYRSKCQAACSSFRDVPVSQSTPCVFRFPEKPGRPVTTSSRSLQTMGIAKSRPSSEWQSPLQRIPSTIISGKAAVIDSSLGFLHCFRWGQEIGRSRTKDWRRTA